MFMDWSWGRVGIVWGREGVGGRGVVRRLVGFISRRCLSLKVSRVRIRGLLNSNRVKVILSIINLKSLKLTQSKKVISRRTKCSRKKRWYIVCFLNNFIHSKIPNKSVFIYPKLIIIEIDSKFNFYSLIQNINTSIKNIHYWKSISLNSSFISNAIQQSLIFDIGKVRNRTF